jgi:uncharacterized protein (DUF362 family)
MRQKPSKVWIQRVDDLHSYDEIRGALAEILDGMKKDFKRPPEKEVLIKLNLCLLKDQETGATVDPRVARAVVEWFLAHYDLEKIYLAEADATHLGAEMAFQILGWNDLFRDLPKVELLNLSQDAAVPVPGRYIDDLRMSKRLMEAGFLISLAKLKTHTQQKITCTMKNMFGAIPYKYKIVYHPMLAKAIYDAVAARVPDLCIIDGLIAMEGNGPTNGIPRKTKLVLASNDAVSMDHFCARLMGFRPMSIPHLRLALKQGLGSGSYQILGTPPNPLNLRFKFLPKWKEIIKKGIGMIQTGAINEEA